MFYFPTSAFLHNIRNMLKDANKNIMKLFFEYKNKKGLPKMQYNSNSVVYACSLAAQDASVAKEILPY